MSVSIDKQLLYAHLSLGERHKFYRNEVFYDNE